jgi:hypothetical protein
MPFTLVMCLRRSKMASRREQACECKQFVAPVKHIFILYPITPIMVPHSLPAIWRFLASDNVWHTLGVKE